MSIPALPRPADVASCASAAIRSLTDEQLASVVAASRSRRRRILPACWSEVQKAAPDLADTLDDLHARETVEDLPRFQALAAEHEKKLGMAVKGRPGKLTALSAIAATVLGVATIVLTLTGVVSLAVTVTGAILTLVLLSASYTGGRRLARRTGRWMFADPEAAAAIVWDAGIDAAAATALSNGSVPGVSPGALRTLSAVWKGAGLDTGGLRAETHEPGTP